MRSDIPIFARVWTNSLGNITENFSAGSGIDNITSGIGTNGKTHCSGRSFSIHRLFRGYWIANSGHPFGRNRSAKPISSFCEHIYGPVGLL